MDLGMSRELQVSIPMPSNYPHIQDTSRIQQIYGTKGGGVFTGVVEGLNPPEDLRSQVQAIRPSPSTHIHEPMSPATRNANGPVPPHPSVIEDMRTHQPHPGRPYPQHETNRISNNGSPNVEGIVPSKPVRYRECRKNHAASIGGYAVDGCGEFMPSGQEGTPAALKCAACNCHRNFHRREVEGEARCDCHHTRR